MVISQWFVVQPHSKSILGWDWLNTSWDMYVELVCCHCVWGFFWIIWFSLTDEMTKRASRRWIGNSKYSVQFVQIHSFSHVSIKQAVQGETCLPSKLGYVLTLFDPEQDVSVPIKSPETFDVSVTKFVISICHHICYTLYKLQVQQDLP